MTLENEIKIHLQGYEERKRLAMEREKLLDDRDAAIHQSILNLTDKMEQTLISVRDSTPASLSKILQDLQDKSSENGETLDILSEKVSPVVRALDTAGNIRVAVIWISGTLLAVSGIIASIVHIKNSIK